MASDLFSPKVNSVKKSSRIVGQPPDYPETGGQDKRKMGTPNRTNSGLSIKKPGGR